MNLNKFLFGFLLTMSAVCADSFLYCALGWQDLMLVPEYVSIAMANKAFLDFQDELGSQSPNDLMKLSEKTLKAGRNVYAVNMLADICRLIDNTATSIRTDLAILNQHRSQAKKCNEKVENLRIAAAKLPFGYQVFVPWDFDERCNNLICENAGQHDLFWGGFNFICLIYHALKWHKYKTSIAAKKDLNCLGYLRMMMNLVKIQVVMLRM